MDSGDEHTYQFMGIESAKSLGYTIDGKDYRMVYAAPWMPTITLDNIFERFNIRQYEAYAEGVVNQETYLKNKKDLNEKIEIIQDKYEQIQEVTSVEDNLMKDIRIVEKNAEEVNILKKMTRHIAETFVEEITIYDSEKIEIRFVFDDLLIGMADRIKKKTEDIA